MTDLVCGGEAVSERTGVTVQSGVGVPPDGVVREQGLSHWAGDLQYQVVRHGEVEGTD